MRPPGPGLAWPAVHTGPTPPPLPLPSSWPDLGQPGPSQPNLHHHLHHLHHEGWGVAGGGESLWETGKCAEEICCKCVKVNVEAAGLPSGEHSILYSGGRQSWERGSHDYQPPLPPQPHDLRGPWAQPTSPNHLLLGHNFSNSIRKLKYGKALLFFG